MISLSNSGINYDEHVKCVEPYPGRISIPTKPIRDFSDGQSRRIRFFLIPQQEKDRYEIIMKNFAKRTALKCSFSESWRTGKDVVPPIPEPQVVHGEIPVSLDAPISRASPKST
ncbi:hypothetical protein FHL15_010095 [Xylaria flabelliformis]|uniref:Uncharacterized protein n=1 Tax=Xylaria flabelliformis TaxID=2512241 RepID=A0A553HLY6_9PEZI|nr:hypothetical protein FHL15_010095 [Xylaria flabelliformis]